MHRALRNSLPAVLVSALFAGCETDRATPLGAGTPDSPGSVALSTQGIPEFPSSPDEFVDGITNPYLAFQRGRVFRYEGQTADGVETTVVEVLNKAKRILGVAVTVVHDRVYLDGELIEDTFDWYAQDRSGNVWYFGEDSKTIEDGKVVSTEGSWQAGVNGARPGIVMLAQPNVGDQYQQEFASGVAEDRAKVMSLSEVVQVPYGTFTGCLQTQEWTPLAPGPRESKYYAPGVGLVLETAPGGERVELIAIEN